MTGGGLAEVANPSALFLAERDNEVTGAAVFAGMEGTRPVLVEIQSLIAPSALGTPRRAVLGWDSGRLAMIMAVLEARCGLALGASDVYLNVAGGLKIGEPAADLAVAAALVSSFSGVPVPPETVVFGEIGLSGEVRAVAQVDALPTCDRSLVVIDPGGEPLRQGSLPPHSVLAFGAEREGLSRKLMARAARCVSIPMAPGVSSLNLATAVSAVLYAWRLGGPSPPAPLPEGEG